MKPGNPLTGMLSRIGNEWPWENFPRERTQFPMRLTAFRAFLLVRITLCPGFPEMAWGMIEWALDTYHAHLFHQEKSD